MWLGVVSYFAAVRYKDTEGQTWPADQSLTTIGCGDTQIITAHSKSHWIN